MTLEELQELLAEQFSCDASELGRSTALADLGADHEDMVELAWALGEALGVEIDENDLSVEMTVGELWHGTWPATWKRPPTNKARFFAAVICRLLFPAGL